MRRDGPDQGVEAPAAARSPTRRQRTLEAMAWFRTGDGASRVPAAGEPRNGLAEWQIHRPQCPPQGPVRRSRARALLATLRAPRKWLWWQAILAARPLVRRPSAAGPTPSSSLATGPKPRSPSTLRRSETARPGWFRRILYPSHLHLVAHTTARHG